MALLPAARPQKHTSYKLRRRCASSKRPASDRRGQRDNIVPRPPPSLGKGTRSTRWVARFQTRTPPPLQLPAAAHRPPFLMGRRREPMFLLLGNVRGRLRSGWGGNGSISTMRALALSIMATVF